MKKILLGAIAILAVASSPAFAQKARETGNRDAGKQAYEVQCSICHGVDAKGNGFYTASLKVNPPDLTSLSKKNGGVFPVDRVARIIDGRTELAAHGSRDMPIWGKRWAAAAAEYYVDAPYNQEGYIRVQVLAILDYLNRVQQK